MAWMMYLGCTLPFSCECMGNTKKDSGNPPIVMGEGLSLN
jgi:hypothetical protein